MTPFKEPQPRKTPEGGIQIVPKGVFPPYARVGNEARWEDGAKERAVLPAGTEPTPPTPNPDHSPFELRKAALEAACALQTSSAREAFWKNLATCEAYLRDGTKPS